MTEKKKGRLLEPPFCFCACPAPFRQHREKALKLALTPVARK
jgi:hypothetical protein